MCLCTSYEHLLSKFMILGMISDYAKACTKKMDRVISAGMREAKMTSISECSPVS